MKLSGLNYAPGEYDDYVVTIEYGYNFENASGKTTLYLDRYIREHTKKDIRELFKKTMKPSGDKYTNLSLISDDVIRHCRHMIWVEKEKLREMVKMTFPQKDINRQNKLIEKYELMKKLVQDYV